MSGGIDGRRALTHAALVRRYMDHWGTWASSYRFVLALVQELPLTPRFLDTDLNTQEGEPDDEFRQEAVWDVFFTRLGGIQEYGFHAGIEPLMWATDQLSSALASLDWPALSGELDGKAREWTGLIIGHATRERGFFVTQSASMDMEEQEVA